MNTINLPKYVSLLKNLRAIAFFEPKGKIPTRETEWLKRKYRYRNIGIAESLILALEDEYREAFLKKPFEILESPLEEISEFTEIISRATPETPRYVIDSLILASCYVNALLVLGRESFSILKPFTAWKMKSTAELPENEVKRNLRIVGYTILDFHNKLIEEAYKTLKRVSKELREKENFDEAKINLKKLIDKRAKMAEKDGKRRFWRLKQKGKEKERTVIAYLDILPLISRILIQKKELSLNNFIYKSTQNLAMTLSLIPAFILNLRT